MIGDTLRVRSRGGVLFELLLAIAVFAGAAAFALGTVKSVFAALDRSRREQVLIDVARSHMAELEAGLISLADLRDGDGGRAASEGLSANEQLNEREQAGSRTDFRIDVKANRTELTDLLLVTITVSESFNGEISADGGLSYTLRQLMPLQAD